MRLVDERGFASVAFPVIGAGTGGFGEEGALAIMLQAFDALQSPAAVTLVRYAPRR